MNKRTSIEERNQLFREAVKKLISTGVPKNLIKDLYTAAGAICLFGGFTFSEMSEETDKAIAKWKEENE